MFRSKILWIAVVVIVLAGGVFAIYENHQLDIAHSTFENYYAFRGCTQLISRTDTAGVCKDSAGETIKIVKFNGEWYLDGDLPICWHGICVGL